MSEADTIRELQRKIRDASKGLGVGQYVKLRDLQSEFDAALTALERRAEQAEAEVEQHKAGAALIAKASLEHLRRAKQAEAELLDHHDFSVFPHDKCSICDAPVAILVEPQQKATDHVHADGVKHIHYGGDDPNHKHPWHQEEDE